MKNYPASERPSLAKLKEQITIPIVWHRLGLRGIPTKSCQSPFRKDDSPSFSVYACGKRWKDFSTGEGGDVIDFIATAAGLNLKEAVRLFLTYAGY